MKKRFSIWKRLLIIVGTIVLALGIYAAVMLMLADNARGSVERLKADLRRQGFKTDLAEFNFSVPASEQGFQRGVERLQSSMRLTGGRTEELPTLMQRASPDSAIVAWKADSVTTVEGTYSWSEYISAVEARDSAFDDVRATVFSEPIRFDLDASRGMAMLLPQLAQMKQISLECSAAAVVDLHNQDRAAAWTNLMAGTRLVTAWEPEPSQISHMVRFALMPTDFQTTWEALQAGDWPEEQLATLQREWESADFFKNVPETFAFMRAGALDACEKQRKEATQSFNLGAAIKAMAQSPMQSPQMVKWLWAQLRYLYGGGVYEDEKALLLFYRDREVEMRNAVKASSWQAMMSMSGVTNQPVFPSRYPSGMGSMMMLRQMNPIFANRGMGFLGRAASAESYRRLMVTGIALERFRMRHGHYPAGLDELVPEFLKQPAIDFIDGQPLRYRLGLDGRFVLYSIGLDCVDDGGVIPETPAARARAVLPRPGPMAMRETGDLVWPRAATSNEVVVLHERELQARRQDEEFKQRMESEEYWNQTATRQVRADNSFVQPEADVNANSLNGRSVSDILRNENMAETNTLAEMLTLRQVITGAEPETITFEAPIKFDAVTNVGGLNLLIDLNKGDALEEAEGTAAQVEISRATNGNCRLAWHTIFEAAGRHTLQMGLFMESGNWRKVVAGPIAMMEVTNLCQFSESSANFDSATGAWLFAKVPESKADYSMDIFAPGGKRVKTIGGSTSNGEFEIFWDLVGEDGKKLAEQSFSTVVRVTLPESGRTQTLKGP